jgi:hypothetical protein
MHEALGWITSTAKTKNKTKQKQSQVLVFHTCNPSYSGGSF